MLKLLTTAGFVFFLCFETIGQNKITKQQYIDSYKAIAVREMLTYGIPASITLAQGMLESGDGNSTLALKANNHFGIKCHGEWEGETFYQDDDSKNECFRKYNYPEQSYEDHSTFLKTRERYSGLFILKRTDYEGWAKGLKKAGYATNPNYPELLIKLISDWNLHEFDKLEKIPKEWEKTIKPSDKNTPIKPKKENSIMVTREVFIINNIKAIKIKNGDTWQSITQEFGMGFWEIFRYNEIAKTKIPVEGEIIYLQPKRRKSNVGCHIVSGNETLWDISQKYGVKTKFLSKWNSILENSAFKPGEKVKLKRKACNHD
jgi:LysM repeat protein